MTTETVNWNITVSKETDRSLRRLLGNKGQSESDIAHFVERAVAKAAFRDTVDSIQTRNAKAGISVEEMEEAIEEALKEVRAEMWGPKTQAG